MASEFEHTQMIEPATFEATELLNETKLIHNLTCGELSSPTAEHVDPQTLSITFPKRYKMLGLLGQGGMGFVLRVQDTKLNRSIAMKVLHQRLHEKEVDRQSFIEEAQIEAQLQHPSIVTVHDTGVLPSGQIYFTMREIRGKNWRTILLERENVIEHRFKIIEQLHRVCEAVGFAHSRGVIHRDLKPSNVMIGQHGEIWVVDWGIAKVLNPDSQESITTNSIPSQDSENRIIGTPLYLSPEQALGANDFLSPAADVYALGVILYQILVGERPYSASTLPELLTLVRAAKWTPFQEHSNERELPNALVQICKKALSKDAEDRYPNATAMAIELSNWLTGDQQEQLAAEETEQATLVIAGAQKQIEALERQLLSLNQRLAQLDRTAPIEEKSLYWSQETELTSRLEQYNWQMFEGEMLLQTALNKCPHYPPAVEALLSILLSRHKLKEQKGESKLKRLELQIQKLLAALPADNQQRQCAETYLSGTGWLSLHTSVSGANVLLERYELQDRRLVPMFDRTLGRTPLEKLPLPIGSYRLRIQLDGHHEVLYPVFIERNQHWDGIPPNAHEPLPIWLPPIGSLREHERYIPASWIQLNGDPLINEEKPRTKEWVDGFILQQHSVSNREYLHMMNTLISEGEPHEAVAQLGPKLRTRDNYTLLLLQKEDGSFELQPDREGDCWHLDAPIVHLVYDSIVYYKDWYSQHTGQPYQLPSTIQLFKAGRGADLRNYVWGDHFDYCWANARNSQLDRGPSERYRYPTDISPYEIYDLIGNAGDAVSDDCQADSYKMHSGSWVDSGLNCRLGRTTSRIKKTSYASGGLRLCRPLPET